MVGGIPVLLGRGEDDGEASAQRSRQKGKQAEFFDAEDPEFEITRPGRTPAFHGWLLEEKYRRSVSHLGHLLRGSVVLAVCAGSGMDSEFLARDGAAVIAADISLGAAQRTRERARRAGLAIHPVVADAERLPFRDAAVTLTYVHDGLHHLEDPARGIAEMARVAQRGVAITEPGKAGATALAVTLGLALEYEEAGNRVARLRRETVASQLREAGLDVVWSERYAMYYKHQPGPVSRLCSRPGLLTPAQAAFKAANRILAPVGNKLTVQALRADGVPPTPDRAAPG